MDFLDFPDVVIDKIFSYLSFAEISSNREVCTRFNQLCGASLNRGFIHAEKLHLSTLKSIKSGLPRRESERRIHPLFKHSDILLSIETRMTMLSMTYQKWIDAKDCPFIPGKVLDEILKVLKNLKKSISPRPHEMLKELRDLSSMAIEHFQEFVVPLFKKNKSIRYDLHNDQHYVTYNEFNSLVALASATRSKVKEQQAQINELRKHIAQLEARIYGFKYVLNPVEMENSACLSEKSNNSVTNMNLKRSASYKAPCSSKKKKIS